MPLPIRTPIGVLNNVVVLRPLGGLGNQLFIWAAGLVVAQKTQASLVLVSDWYKEFRHRELELFSFDSGLKSPRVHGLPVIGDRIAQSRYRRLPVFDEIPVGVDPRFPGTSAPVFLRGHFQSRAYFDSRHREIFRRIRSVKNPSTWFLGEKKRLQEIGPHTSVHVRHGDYLTHPQLGVLPPAYYLRGIRELGRISGAELPLVLHSDSPQSARKMLAGSGIDIIHTVSAPPEVKPVEKLVLAAEGERIIMANSSFSWWASEMSDAHYRIAPRPWFFDKTLDTSALESPAWTFVPSW